MSDAPNPFGPPDWADEPRQPGDDARKLVNVAVILLYVVGGLDFIGVPILIAYGVFAPEMLKMNSATASMPAMTMPGFSSMVRGLFIFLACISLLQGVLKMIGATKLHTGGRGAWGWGLAAAIACCLELECYLACVVPLTLGIITIVLLSKAGVRPYLAGRRAGRAGGDGAIS